MLLKVPKIQAPGIVNASAHIADGDYFYPVAREREGCNRAHVAEPLDYSRCLAQIEPHGIGSAVDKVADASTGGLPPSWRAADNDRLASNNAGNGIPRMDGISIHHPGHDLFVRPQIGRHDIHLRADKRNHFLSESACEPFQLGDGHFARIAGNAAL